MAVFTWSPASCIAVAYQEGDGEWTGPKVNVGQMNQQRQAGAPVSALLHHHIPL